MTEYKCKSARLNKLPRKEK